MGRTNGKERAERMGKPSAVKGNMGWVVGTSGGLIRHYGSLKATAQQLVVSEPGYTVKNP